MSKSVDALNLLTTFSSRHGIAQSKYETLEGRHLSKEITGAVRLSKRYIIELYIINDNKLGIYLFIYLSIYLFIYLSINIFNKINYIFLL